MQRLAVVFIVCLTLPGCRSGMIQYAGGVVHSAGDEGSSGPTLSMSVGAGDAAAGRGVAGTASFMFTDRMGVLVEEGQLQVIGQRWGSVRPFARAGVGFNLGWVDDCFGGGGAASATLGVALGRARDGFTLHARAARLGRIGDAPGETLFGVYLGWAAIWRAND